MEIHSKGKAVLPHIPYDRVAARLRPGMRKAVPFGIKWAVTTLKESKKDIEQETEERIALARKEFDRLSRVRCQADDDKLEGRVSDEFFAAECLEWEERTATLQDEIGRLDRVKVKCLDRAVQIMELSSEAYDLTSPKTTSNRPGSSRRSLRTANCRRRGEADLPKALQRTGETRGGAHRRRRRTSRVEGRSS